ncbi:MAG: GNAT family N-acetyltransferase [Blastocatellia bacterium]|nr:GNAT family N-acetyltransferase [Blastocatellia bacterium]
MEEIKQRYLSLLPDLPRWVETRDLLLWEGSVVLENSSRSGFIVWSEEDALGAVVGEPDPVVLARAAKDVSELLAFSENIMQVRSLLPGFLAESATIYSAPAQLPSSPAHICRKIGQREISSLRHLSADLLEELSDAAEDGRAVVAALDGGLPVSFAYVASETETLWDVSIDTIESHRRQGYAAAAVLYLMRLMRRKRKAAVWGALESNHASSNLARRLGFTENDKLWVLTSSGA